MLKPCCRNFVQDCRSVFPSGFTFQQDGAPAHMAKLAQDWIATKCSEFIGKDEWHSPTSTLWTTMSGELCLPRPAGPPRLRPRQVFFLRLLHMKLAEVSLRSTAVGTCYLAFPSATNPINGAIFQRACNMRATAVNRRKCVPGGAPSMAT